MVSLPQSVQKIGNQAFDRLEELYKGDSIDSVVSKM